MKWIPFLLLAFTAHAGEPSASGVELAGRIMDVCRQAYPTQHDSYAKCVLRIYDVLDQITSPDTTPPVVITPALPTPATAPAPAPQRPSLMDNIGRGLRDGGEILNAPPSGSRADLICINDCTRRYSYGYCQSLCRY
jgi:hypothetical protein